MEKLERLPKAVRFYRVEDSTQAHASEHLESRVQELETFISRLTEKVSLKVETLESRVASIENFISKIGNLFSEKKKLGFNPLI
jgi:hypothetical protein